MTMDEKDKRQTQRSRRSIRRAFLPVSAALLVVLLSIGTAIAYFTDYEDAKGGAVLKLTGQTETEEHLDGLNKQIAVSNTGETDMVVRVLIFGDKEKMEVTPEDGWEGGFDEETGGYVYYYSRILKGGKAGEDGSVTGGETTSGIYAAVTSAAEEDIAKFDITVVHESARVVYENDEGGEYVKQPAGWTGMPRIAGEGAAAADGE